LVGSSRVLPVGTRPFASFDRSVRNIANLSRTDSLAARGEVHLLVSSRDKDRHGAGCEGHSTLPPDNKTARGVRLS